jgi:hypothetical protein
MAALALTLCCLAAHAADDTAAAPDPVSPGTTAPKARVPRPHIHRTPGQGIEETVHRLARGLDLDAPQQVKLREILWDQQRQMRRLRENPGPGIDWASTTAGIVARSKERIRAMLNDEQKKKYSVDVPRDGLGPAQADLQHWIDLQDSRRQQGLEASK